MFGSDKDVSKNKITKSTKEVLDLETQKMRLEMERDQIQLELDNMKTRQSMALEKEDHKHQLALESKTAIFEREKEIWAKEKQELIDRAERDKKEFESNLKRDLEIKHNEAITLTKLESQQKIKQAELDKDRAINELKADHAGKVAAIQASESEKYHDKLSNALQEITMNGDKNTKFVQEMALKLVDKAPAANGVGIDVNLTNEPRQLNAANEE